jgi:hypothetical protein
VAKNSDGFGHHFGDGTPRPNAVLDCQIFLNQLIPDDVVWVFPEPMQGALLVTIKQVNSRADMGIVAEARHSRQIRGIS